jgi:hypothetical protein
VKIRELRILPPLAIGRLGAAPTPMDNYDVAVDPDRPLGPRRIIPARTFLVDPESGEITSAFVPDELRFAEEGKARPVAPFLEVWALTEEGELLPLTSELLSQAGVSPADVRWYVHLGNHKIYRRTNDPADKIDAEVEVSGHERQAVEGTCPHFWDGKRLPLGEVQYVKPAAEFPEIRLRYTPAGGFVYGSSRKSPDHPDAPDLNIKGVLYDANRGKWLGYEEGENPKTTIPGQIFAGHEDDGKQVSAGYLDDECDGIVRVELTVGGERLSAYAHLGAGPPAYAPDRFPIRTIADELKQAIEGPAFDPRDVTTEEIAEVEEIVRRAFETVQLMNTEVMNGNTVDGRVDVASTMVRQDSGDTGRLFEPIMATSLVDMAALENLHQSLLVALRSGTAPWFAEVLRDYDKVGDLSSHGRRKMPAMMRGADGRHLTLTRRQVNIIRAVASRAISARDNSLPGRQEER